MKFLGLSTGRAGSRYLTAHLNAAGVKTLHEVNPSPKRTLEDGAVGEVSAHFVTTPAPPTAIKVWHFSRHPQPFVTSLIKFGFWQMNAAAIHPYLRRTGDIVADSFLYWVDWNRRILHDTNPPQRITFRIEDISYVLIRRLAASIGIEADATAAPPIWNEAQEFAPIPGSVAGEVGDVMGALGYA